MTQSNKNYSRSNLWRSILILTFLLSIIISILLILTYFQLRRVDPVNTKVIDALVERLNQSPGDIALRNEIREMDLLARKAYFTNQWQIRFGGHLLIISIILMIISALRMDFYNKKIETVKEASGFNFVQIRKNARRWITISGVAVALIALMLAFLTGKKIGDKFDIYSVKRDSESADIVKSHPDTESVKSPEKFHADAKDQGKTTLKLSSSLSFPTGEMKRNFPSFRGVGGNGIVYQKNIPDSWDGASGKNIKWKSTIPLPGNNSPIIWGNKVFITGANSSRQEVYCYDLNSGNLTWKTEVRGIENQPAVAPNVSEETGFAAPTAACDGENVFAIFANGNIIALNMKGEKIWARNLGMPDNHYGYSSSLYVINDKVIVQYDGDKSCQVMALSSKTGVTYWNTTRNSKISWASPVIVNRSSSVEILLVGEPYVISYDPLTGKELWKTKCISGEVGPSLAFADDMVFSVEDNDRLAAFRPGDNSKIIWEHNDYLSDVPSPVATEKYLIIATSYGEVACYNPKTGELFWHHDFGTGSYASPIIAGDKVYLLDKNGTMHIFMTSKSFTLVSEPGIPGKNVFATPAFADGKIIIRAGNNLYCVTK